MQAIPLRGGGAAFHVIELAQSVTAGCPRFLNTAVECSTSMMGISFFRCRLLRDLLNTLPDC